MAISNIFDKAKKQVDGGCLDSGYVIDGTLFDCYYTNKEWDDFVSEMERDHHELWLKFSEGDGGELNEYKDDYGNPRPPKMASYASSSRFMYEMAVTIDGFTVEEKLSTGLGGRKASLDGYLASKNLYVEAKCHEFYSHSKPELRKGHKALYDDGIIPLLPHFSYEPKEIGQRVNLSFDGDIYNFDLKQMLCHLCGIANKVLKEGLQKVNFIYLIYKPTEELLAQIPSKKDRDAIQDLFVKEKEKAEEIPFNDIFCAILKYFNKKKTRRYIDMELELFSDKDHFNFIVCDQTDFKDVVKHL